MPAKKSTAPAVMLSISAPRSLPHASARTAATRSFLTRAREKKRAAHPATNPSIPWRIRIRWWSSPAVSATPVCARQRAPLHTPVPSATASTTSRSASPPRRSRATGSPPSSNMRATIPPSSGSTRSRISTTAHSSSFTRARRRSFSRTVRRSTPSVPAAIRS